MSSEARVALGRVVAVFGVRGWVKVHSYTRPPERILEYPRWWIARGAGYATPLIDGRPQGRTLVVRLADAEGRPLDDRDRAAELVGARIEVERSLLPPPPAGSYYWADLLGLEVRSLSGATLGQVEALTDNGAQDVLVVTDGERQRLVPFVPGPIVRAVNLENGVIVVDWEPDY